MQIGPLQMSCQAFGNTQQLDLHFFWQAAQAKAPGKDHSSPGAFTKVEKMSKNLRGVRPLIRSGG
jgi:hypothetical protein